MLIKNLGAILLVVIKATSELCMSIYLCSQTQKNLFIKLIKRFLSIKERLITSILNIV